MAEGNVELLPMEDTEVRTDSASAQESVGTEDSAMMDTESLRLEEKLQSFQNELNDHTAPSVDPWTMTNQLRELEKQRRRNLIFDEERFEETFLKCLICRESYNDNDKTPKMLPCHHTFCLDCLCQMFRVEGEFRQSLSSAFRGMPLAVKIQCPSCRDGLITSEAELRRLPNDHTILELLSFVKETGRTDVQYCSKHQLQPLHFFCEPCIQPVCCDCTVIDHKESKGHVVVNVDEALAKYTPILDDTMASIRTQKEEVTKQRQALGQAAETVDRIQQDLTDHIRTVFDRIRAVLDERERELYDISDGEINRKRSTIEAHQQTLSERETALDAQLRGLQQAKNDKDISQMFTGHKTACEVLQNRVHVPTDCISNFNVTFQFNQRTDATVRQQINNLGDIIFKS
ncbi:tripartite motif-containing protein 2-like isoform X4 [Pomacea canaliculata]|uniref:tripartite motif-containing protein 2-like isoform X4 n=1 Tax=Pomacea canaliculata TaxID=400727 RepID=UPI000D72D5A3|nr:tripartite motif-containing protein 2-like isoform X4 [Pomacea canaliculata]